MMPDRTGVESKLEGARPARGRLRPWMHGTGAAITLAALLVASVWMARVVGHDAVKETLDEELATVARLAAQRVDPVAHAALTDPAQQNGPEYRRVVEPLREMLRATPNFKYMYTMRQSPEGIRFVIDAADPVDGDGDGVIDQAKLGELYPEPDPATVRAFTEGGAAVSPRPKTDQWGTFISAFAPVRGPDGRIECVVGVDSTVETHEARLARIDRAGALVMTLGLAASVGLGLIVWLMHRRRWEMEGKLAASEQRFRTLTDTVPVMVWLSGLDKGCTDFNRGWLEFTGRTLEQELGAGWVEGVHPEDRERCLQDYSEAFDDRRAFTLIYRLRRHDGVYRTIEDRGVPRYGPGGEFAGYAGGCMDITAQAELRRDLATSEARMRAVIDTALDAVIAMDERGRVTSWNRQAEVTFGWTAEEVMGRPMAEFIIPPELREAHEAGLRRVLTTGERRVLGRRVEVPAVRKDGERIDVELSVNALVTDSGPLFSAFLRDITPRKRAEEALRAATADATRLAAAIDAHTDPVMLADADGRIVRVNPAFERLTGHSAGFAVGRTPSILKSGLTPADIYLDLWKTIRAGRPWKGRLCNRRPALSEATPGELYWVDASITPLLRPGGRVDGFVAVHRDATAQVRAEELERARLEAAEARVRVAKALSGTGSLFDRLRAALEAVLGMQGVGIRPRGGVLTFEPAGMIIRKVVNLGGFSEFVFHTGAGLEGDPLLARAAQTGHVVAWRRCESHSYGCGEEPHGHIAVPLMDRSGVDGACVGALLLVTDPEMDADSARLASLGDLGDLFATAILQDRAAQLAEAARTRAEEASRMKSEFVANMSHEIRTPMTAILGYTELLAEDGEEDASRRLEHIETIRRNGQHLLSLINDILDLSKIEAGKMSVECIQTSPEQILRDVDSLMQVRARAKGVSLEVIRETALPAVIRSDPVRLKQILVNIIGNAIKFTESGGVRVQVGLNGSALTGPELRIDIEDTGIGLTPEHIQRLFGAFSQADSSTTRRFGGTGLGLRISKSLAQLLGGDITVTSEPGRGSLFSVVIPTGPLEGVPMIDPLQVGRILAAEEPAPATAEPTGQPLRNQRIFLAEDGPDNQRLISFHLRRAGATVTVFDNGLLCLKALTVDGTPESPLNPEPPCDLVITDMQMPEMDGYTLASTLRAKGWTRRIIALTANAMSGDADRCLAAGCDRYASKPIDKQRLIAACLETPRRAAA